MKSKEKIISAGIAFAVGGLVFLSLFSGLFHGIELFLEDRLFSPKPVDSRLVIVAIDDGSIQRVGQWPWPREVFAEFLKNINSQNQKPLSVAIDVLFVEKSRRGESDDLALRQALRAVSFPVILAAQAQNAVPEETQTLASSILSPLSIFQTGRASVGVVNVITDRDGVVRYAPMNITDEATKKNYNTLAVETISRAGIAAPKSTLPAVVRIAYGAPSRGIRTIPFYEFLNAKTVPDVSGKIVLVGATAPSLHDTAQTPLSRGQEMAGIEVHGNIADMILSSRSLYNLPFPLAAIWIMTGSLIAAFISATLLRLEMAVLLNIFIGFIYLLAIAFLFERGIVADIIHTTLSWGASTVGISLFRFFTTEKERRAVRNTFSKYVSPHILNQLLEHPEKVVLGGEERGVTVLFSDIRGFTSISEKTTPTELVRILNKYFSTVTKKIIENGGVLDKYIGDAIMAFWGAPLPDEKQADKAVKAAKEMIGELKNLNKELLATGDPEIKIGVGIYTGPAVVGNVGSEHRFDYTVIGDTVNAASRLEGLTKEYQVPIIIGETTKNKLTENFSLKPLGKASVKGKSQTISIYAVET